MAATTVVAALLGAFVGGGFSYAAVNHQIAAQQELTISDSLRSQRVELYTQIIRDSSAFTAVRADLQEVLAAAELDLTELATYPAKLDEAYRQLEADQSLSYVSAGSEVEKAVSELVTRQSDSRLAAKDVINQLLASGQRLDDFTEYTKGDYAVYNATDDLIAAVQAELGISPTG